MKGLAFFAVHSTAKMWRTTFATIKYRSGLVLRMTDGFDDQFRQILDEVQFYSENQPSAQLKQLEADAAQLAREKENLLTSLRMFGPKEMIRGDAVWR